MIYKLMHKSLNCSIIISHIVAKQFFNHSPIEQE